MSVEAERETLERKDRDELQKIAGALGGKVTSRTRKADIIDQILELTGVTGDASNDQADDEANDGEQGSGGDRGQKSDDAAKSDRAQKSGGEKSARRDGKQDEAKSDDAKQDDKKKDEAKGGSGNAKSSGGSDDRSGSRSNGSSNQGRSNTRGKQDDDQDRQPKQGNQSKQGNQGNQSNKGGQDDDQDDRNDDQGDDGEGGRRRRRRGRNRDAGPQQDEFTGEPIPVVGCLDLRDDGYGFLRVDGMLPSKDDCYVSVKQVRQFGLRKGDIIAGGSRPAFRNEKNPAILRIDSVNDVALEPGTERPLFEELTAVFASEALSLVVDDDAERTTRALELLAPMGKGSRVLVAAPPRTGKTTLLQALARSVEANEPDVTLIVVLLDERPEEITEMERLVAAGTVHGSAFDAEPDDHVAVLELALARARRVAEAGDDVVVLVDGLTRLARAAHAAGSGSQGNHRTVGGIETSAIQAAKRAFGSGRKLEDAGSVTVVATASVDTGSEIDDAVHDAVLGAATTLIRLDHAAAERRSFPALDVGRTTTRREELLVGDQGAEQREALRRLLAAAPVDGDAANADGLDTLLSRLRDTPSNDDLLEAAAKEETSR